MKVVEGRRIQKHKEQSCKVRTHKKRVSSRHGEERGAISRFINYVVGAWCVQSPRGIQGEALVVSDVNASQICRQQNLETDYTFDYWKTFNGLLKLIETGAV